MQSWITRNKKKEDNSGSIRINVTPLKKIAIPKSNKGRLK